jgi:hypothetical protein
MCVDEQLTGLHLVFAEPDYRFAGPDHLYGAGPLALRIEHVDRTNAVHHAGDLWYPVAGEEIGYNGAELGHRDVQIRAHRIPAHCAGTLS